MDLRIVNPDPKYSTVTLIPPATLGYVHLAAEVRPPPRPGPVIRTPRQKAELIGGLKVLARQLEQVAAVEKVTVYEATVMAPPAAMSDSTRIGCDRPASTSWCWWRRPLPRPRGRCRRPPPTCTALPDAWAARDEKRAALSSTSCLRSGRLPRPQQAAALRRRPAEQPEGLTEDHLSL
jgi:hypothetical protein